MKIEIIKINSQGDGVGLFNNKKVFVPKTCIGDIVEFKIIDQHKDYINGELVSLVKESEDRVKNIICSFYNKCGGCNLLHLNEKEYYNYKRNIVKDAIIKSGFNLEKFDFIEIPQNSRRRVTFKVKGDKIGFFEKGTNKLIEIGSCFLIKKEINNIVGKLKDLIKNISVTEITVTSYDNGLEILFTFSKELTIKENEILKNFAQLNSDIIIVSYKVNDKEPYLFFQKQAPALILDNGIKLELSTNIFLQATLEGQNAITNIVVEGLKSCKNVLDLYCGIGTYSFPLAKYVKVHSVEGSQRMIDILNKNIKNNNLLNRISSECRNLVSSPLLKNELNKFDGIVINPPRNGANAQCKNIAESNVKNIVMVSCNPLTFITDAKELKLANYKLKKIVGIDQFYRTPHLEIVGVFEKSI